MINESWLSFPVGILIASVVSSVGIGGGILWMPFFLIVLKLRPDAAVLTSLIIQTAGMGSGSMAYVKQKRVDRRLALFLLLVTVPGIAAGAWAARIIRPAHLELILGGLTLATAFLFVSAGPKYNDPGSSRVRISKAFRYSWFVSLCAVASGMLSVSIGEWLVPIMRSKLSLRMINAVATSIVTIFGTCIIGTTIHLLMGGAADLSTIMWAVPGVLIGGQIGPRITEKINDRILKEIFVFLLTLIGIHLIYNSY